MPPRRIRRAPGARFNVHYADGVSDVDQEPGRIQHLATVLQELGGAVLDIVSVSPDDPLYRKGVTDLTVGYEGPEWDIVVTWEARRHQPEEPATAAAGPVRHCTHGRCGNGPGQPGPCEGQPGRPRDP